MLILAGVSINAIVGENGVLTKAKEASIASQKASILEAIDLELASYNIDTILNNPEEISAMLNNLISKGAIDTVLSSSGPTTDTSLALGIPQFDDANNYTGYIDYAVTKEDYSILLSVDGSGIYKAKYGEVNISSGGSVAAGTTVVTSNAFSSESGTENPEDSGKFTIDNDASVMFVDEIGQNGEELSILVKSGVHAKVNIFKDMTLTNQGIDRSAIDIEPGGTLDLYVADGVKLEVNSGFGKAGGNTTQGEASKGGPGAYAGIHVPVNANLNISGSGSITCCGGSAGDGGHPSGTYDGTGGAGGGGAGAGIGGNGGKGGDSILQSVKIYVGKLDNPFPPDEMTSNGSNGEDCGNVYITDTTVKAVGGSSRNSNRTTIYECK